MPELLPDAGGLSAPVRTAFPGRPVVELVGGIETRKMIEYGFYTVPTGVFFQFRVAAGVTDATTILNIARGFSGELEAAFTKHPQIVALSYLQDISPGDQLIDTIQVIVAQTDPPGERSFELPLYRFTEDNLAPLVDRAVQEMAALTVTS